MPLESLLIKLQELGYKGSFSLDVSSGELDVGEDEKVLRKLSEAKAFFEKYFSTK